MAAFTGFRTPLKPRWWFFLTAATDSALTISMQCRGFRSDANIQLRKNCLTGVNSTLLLPLFPPPPPSPRPTLEVTIVETASTLRRKKRADLGIALIDI
jgi:hypothetical protein